MDLKKKTTDKGTSANSTDKKYISYYDSAKTKGTYNGVTYFTVDKYIGKNESKAENEIVKVLNTLKIKHFREVAFKELTNTIPKSIYTKEFLNSPLDVVEYQKKHRTITGYPRFDFMFFLNSKMILLEYDGAQHNTTDMITRDATKTKFCNDHNITLIRLNNQHYYKLHVTIEDIIKLHR